MEHIKRETGKNTLVLFYAKWCGHCHALVEPRAGQSQAIWDRVSRTLHDMGAATVQKLEASDPNGGVQAHQALAIRGYPTIMLFPANGAKPITYSGPRSHDALVEFAVSV